MCEMLGNQYFLARNFSEAEKEYEKCLAEHPENKLIRKKLIICHTQTGKFNQAINEFLYLAREDLDFLTHTDIVEDDCPCAEIIYEIEKDFFLNIEDSLTFTIMGILWAYCDLDRAYEYFKKSLEIKKDERVEKILSLINEKTTTPNQGGNL